MYKREDDMMEGENKTIKMDITITVPVEVELTEFDTSTLIRLPEFNSLGYVKYNTEVEDTVKMMIISHLNHIKWKISNQGR